MELELIIKTAWDNAVSQTMVYVVVAATPEAWYGKSAKYAEILTLAKLCILDFL